MKKIMIYVGIMLISVVLFCHSQSGARQGEKTSGNTLVETKIIQDAEIWEREKTDYQVQSDQLKDQAQKLKKIYEEKKDNDSLIAYKEAELSYELSSFYEKEGERWILSQQNNEEAEILSQVATCEYYKAELSYRESCVHSFALSRKEMKKKFDKGLITSLEYEEADYLWKEEKSLRDICKNNISYLEKILKQKTGKTEWGNNPLSSTIQHDSYFKHWEQNRIELLHYDNEIQAYRSYIKGLNDEDLQQKEKVKFAENKIELLRLKKKRFITNMKEIVLQKETDLNNAEIAMEVKEEAIDLAKKKLQAVRLLEKKGHVTASQVAAQEAEVEKLEYEKASQKHTRDLRLIELEYCVGGESE